jgi:hypothetical protein
MTRFIGVLLIVLGVFGPVTAHANLVANGDFATGDLTDWTLTANQLTFGANASIVTQTVIPEFTANLNNPAFGFQNIAFDPVLGRNTWVDSSDLFFTAITQTLATTPGHTYRIQYVFEDVGFLESTNLSVGTLLAFFGNDPFLPENSWVESPGCSKPFSCLTPAPPLDQLSKTFGDSLGLDLFYMDGTYSESFTDVATGTSTPLEFAGVDQNSFRVTDIVVTDITPLPEPPTLALFAFGFLAAAFVARRRPKTS